MTRPERPPSRCAQPCSSTICRKPHTPIRVQATTDLHLVTIGQYERAETPFYYPVDVLLDQIHSCDNAKYGDSSGEAWIRSQSHCTKLLYDDGMRFESVSEFAGLG